ncbi:MAG TPA: hypothetical protein DDZ53_07975 [Firmicutes bacterium]|nr:hypothetical protein [Bacillota bacterium]
MLAKEWNDFLNLIPRLRKRMHETSKQNKLKGSSAHYTPAQIDCLYTIATRPDWRMSDLADRLQVSAGSLTTMVNRLIEAGVVDRTRSQLDRRVVMVKLNEAGEDLVQANRQKFVLNLQQLMRDLTPEDRARLSEAMGIVVDILAKIV